MTCLHINNNSSTTELSTIIWIPCGKDVLPCLWWIYCTNLMFFTTQVKTKTVPAMGYSTSIILIQHKSLQRNLIPCQQLLLINPSEPTTPLPSPQCGKTEASEISNTFCWLNFPDFSSGATRYDWLNFSDFFHQEPRDVINLNFLIFHQRALDMENQEIQINKRYHIFTRLWLSVLRAREGRCVFKGILPISEPTITCGLRLICSQVDRPHCVRTWRNCQWSI